jgi:hypothetical protein
MPAIRSFIVYILLLLPFAVPAQNFKIALRGSGLYAFGHSDDDLTILSRNAPGFAGAFQLRHGSDRVEAVYGLEIGALAGKYLSATLGSSTTEATQNIARTYYLQHVMANYKIHAQKLQPYGGIMAGLILTDGTGKVDFNPYISSGNPITFESFKTYGAVLGVQGGAGWVFAPQFELVGELGLRQTWLKESPKSFLATGPHFNYRLLSAHFTIGINYIP